MAATQAAAVSRAALVKVAADAARQAGAVLRSRRSDPVAVATKSSDTDPVSEADRAAEERLVALVRQARPDDGIVGEEGADVASATGLRWLLDPLDGTVNYLYGLPPWAVSVAVEQRQPDGGWEAVAAAVLDVPRDELFTAERGAGAWCDGTRLQVNDPVDLPQALIATGFSYDRQHRARQAAVAAQVLTEARDVRRHGSAALDLCWVAAGRVDGFYEDSLGRWDWAAGALVAGEAGAVVTPLSGALAGRDGVIAAGPSLHGPLAALVTAGGGSPACG